MGGTNPYIEKVSVRLPRRPYTLTFVLGDEKRAVQVDPARLPYSHEGLAGSILDVACGNGIDLDHACGGVCACSTCHVLIVEGGESCNEASDAELDMLDHAPGVEETSRLGCQCVPDGTRAVRVQVPSWNRNAVSEGAH